MKKLPFDRVIRHGEEGEKYEKRIKVLKKEKKLIGEEITEILEKKLQSVGFVTVTERNANSWNTNPLDLVAGDEDDLTMIGFEVKGDTDNFSRLKSQLHFYDIACDNVYLVVHKKNPPEWLPQHMGVLRVFENGDAVIENHPYQVGFLDVSTNFEWDALFKSNALGTTSKRTKIMLGILVDIRRNILFNRFFGKKGYTDNKFEKFYPFTDEQREILIGFDVPYHFDNLLKDTQKLERRLDTIKRLISFGQSDLGGQKRLKSDSKKPVPNS